MKWNESKNMDPNEEIVTVYQVKNNGDLISCSYRLVALKVRQQHFLRNLLEMQTLGLTLNLLDLKL